MYTQCRGKIFWPTMKASLQKKYDECNACQEHKVSQATPYNEVSGEDIFSNFSLDNASRSTIVKRGARTTS